MKRGRERASGRRAARATGATTRSIAWPAGAWVDRVAALLCVAIALWAQRRSLAAYFGLDDLVIFSETRGLRPLVVGPWRLLSRHLYFGALVPRFGSDPFPWHLVGWLLHGANVALLYALVRRRAGGTLAASAAAILFGASRLHAPVLESPARIGEPMALACMLAAFLLADRAGLARMTAAALVAAAMLSKESVALLPLALLLPRPEVPGFAGRIRAAAPLIAASVAVSIALLLSGAASTHLGGEAYQRAYGGNLWLNLMTYAHWTIDVTRALPGLISAIAPDAWPAGIGLLLALAALAALARGRSALPALGATWWLLALLPVLPLLHHTYLYYLYVPLAGLAIAAAGLIEVVRAVLRARWPAPVARRALAVLAVVLLVGYASAADRLLAERLALHLPGTGVPLDPDLRKSETARHAAETVAATIGGRPAHVAFLIPASIVQYYSTSTGARAAPVADSTTYSILEGALDGGVGFRALFPNLDSVAFLPAWKPGYAEFEMFSQSLDGTVFPLGRGPDGYATAGAALRRMGRIPPALEILAPAVGEFPDHARLRYEYAHALYVAGDTLGTKRELEELLRRAPNDTLAARVRGEIGRR